MSTMVASPQTKVTLPAHDAYPRRDIRFWMCFLCIMIASFLVGLDVTGVTTALPTIVADLDGEQFEWVGAAFSMSATALLPFTGALAQAFGRRFTMLLHLAIFTLGSALSGSAQSMNWLIGARVVQGIGAGGFASITQIITSDLVPLHERGIFNALVALAYCFSSAISAPIAGALAQEGQWRWYFYLNIPFCGIAAILCVFYVSPESQRGSAKEKLLGMDWLGNTIVIASSVAIILALTWGGIQFPWNSARVLVPLILGFLGLIAFIVYDKFIPRNPLVPFAVVSSPEAISGYIQAFLGNFVMISLYYYIPVYFQACRGLSPIRSGVLIIPSGFMTMPLGIVAGIVIAKTGKYRVPIWVGWCSLILCHGLYSTMTADSPNSHTVGFQVFNSIGLGIIVTATVFPILAPITVDLNPQALSFFMFVRFFAQAFGVAVGGTVLQNRLKDQLPSDFTSRFPQGTAIVYSIIPVIKTLDEPFRTQVRVAFAKSLRDVFYVGIGVSVVGLLSSLMMRGVSLNLTAKRDNEDVEEKVYELATPPRKDEGAEKSV